MKWAHLCGILCVSALFLLSIGTVSAVEFSGRVYEGETGIEHTTLSGVTVTLYCSNNAGTQGSFVSSSVTNADGWYMVEGPETCEFYNIVVTPPPGKPAVGATSVGGTVISATWIQYDLPLAGKIFTGNKFWVGGGTPATTEPTEPPAPTCPERCECLPVYAAEEAFGSYERCSAEPCGTTQEGALMYCFRPVETPPAPICPEGCECLPEYAAEEAFGSYERCSAEPCGTTQEGALMYCFRPVETPPAPICPEGCECLEEEGAVAMFGNYERCSPDVCAYSPAGEPLYCYRGVETPPSQICPAGCACLPEREGRAYGLVPCEGEVRVCGEDDLGNAYICFEGADEDTVTMDLSPPDPGPEEKVTITARYAVDVDDPRLDIVVNGYGVKSCDDVVCSFTGGPYPEGLVYGVKYKDPNGAENWKAGGQYHGEFTDPCLLDCDEWVPVAGGIAGAKLCKADCILPPLDNCPGVVSKNLNDEDNDGVGDVCDICPGFNNKEIPDCDICSATTLPDRFSWQDWRGVDWLTPVQHQEGCGSCWAFSAVAMVESVYDVEQHFDDLKLYSFLFARLDLSEQNLVSTCYANGDCLGRSASNPVRLDTLKYIRDTGLVTEQCFPYASQQCTYSVGGKTYCCNSTTTTTYGCTDCTCTNHCASPCACSRCSNWNSQLWKITTYSHVGTSVSDIKKGLLCHGPLQSCGDGHCVLIVGWDDAQASWIIKNSWGVNWGTNGYGTVNYTASPSWCDNAFSVGGVYHA
jgi:hypothetical protein